MACPALALRPPSPGVPKRAATARRQALTQVGPVTHSDQVTLGDQVASIDTEDYISGKPTASFIGKLVSWTVPPPVRFFATWLAPSICLVSLFPQAVLGVVVAVLAALQVRPVVHSVLTRSTSLSTTANRRPFSPMHTHQVHRDAVPVSGGGRFRLCHRSKCRACHMRTPQRIRSSQRGRASPQPPAHPGAL